MSMLRSPRAAVAALTLCAALLAGAARTASAQPPARGFVSVNGGYQTGGADFSHNLAIDHPLFGGEKGALETRYSGAGGTLIDVSGGVRIWRNLAVGAGVSQYSARSDAALSGRFPHPLRFNRPRQVSGTATGLDRRERAVHVEVRWLFPVSRAVEVAVFGGPTLFHLQQALVTGATLEQKYPFDEASFASASRQTRADWGIGFHAGADAAFWFSDWLGVGAMVRFSRGSVELGPAGGATAPLDTGGLAGTGGLRLRF